GSHSRSTTMKRKTSIVWAIPCGRPVRVLALPPGHVLALQPLELTLRSQHAFTTYHKPKRTIQKRDQSLPYKLAHREPYTKRRKNHANLRIKCKNLSSNLRGNSRK